MAMASDISNIIPQFRDSYGFNPMNTFEELQYGNLADLRAYFNSLMAETADSATYVLRVIRKGHEKNSLKFHLDAHVCRVLYLTIDRTKKDLTLPKWKYVNAWLDGIKESIDNLDNKDNDVIDFEDVVVKFGKEEETDAVPDKKDTDHWKSIISPTGGGSSQLFGNICRLLSSHYKATQLAYLGRYQSYEDVWNGVDLFNLVKFLADNVESESSNDDMIAPSFYEKMISKFEKNLELKALEVEWKLEMQSQTAVMQNDKPKGRAIVKTKEFCDPEASDDLASQSVRPGSVSRSSPSSTSFAPPAASHASLHNDRWHPDETTLIRPHSPSFTGTFVGQSGGMRFMCHNGGRPSSRPHSGGIRSKGYGGDWAQVQRPDDLVRYVPSHPSQHTMMANSQQLQVNEWAQFEPGWNPSRAPGFGRPPAQSNAANIHTMMQPTMTRGGKGFRGATNWRN